MYDSRICRQLLMSGRVQRVRYRAAMADDAERLGVTSWVRNRRNSDVEAIVCGSPEAVEAITRRAEPAATRERMRDLVRFFAQIASSVKCCHLHCRCVKSRALGAHRLE